MCSQLLVFWENQDSSLPPKFYRCPGWCGLGQKKLANYCRACPTGIADREFKRETIALLEERVNHNWKEYSFESLLEAVYRISAITDEKDDERTRKVARLVDIFRGEQAKIRRTENYNRRQAAKEK